MKKTGVIVLGILLVLFLFSFSVLANNLLTNPDFADGTTDGWYPYGDDNDIEVVTDDPYTGDYCALAFDREDDWQGIGIDLLDIMDPGKYYDMSFMVKLDGSEEQTMGVSIRRDIEGEQDPSFSNLTWLDVEPGEWNELSARYLLPEEDYTNVEIYVEGPEPGIDFYVDAGEIVEVDIDPDAWKERANERIEELRKGDVQINVVDEDGYPVNNAEVNVVQDRREFGFGTAFSNEGLNHSEYREFLSENYEWATFENESKWYWNESSQGNVNYHDADQMYEFCEENDLKVRGHCIFWAVDEYVDDWIMNLTDDQLWDAIDNRLESVVPHFEGKFLHWDVNNEMLHGDFFKRRLGDEVRSYMFERARELDPNAKLFVNDYNVISQAEDNNYKAQIQELQDMGAPIDGIGVQGHFDDFVDPIDVESRLDNLAELDLPIWITEYDSQVADESVRADNLERLYRTAFAHPAVEGIFMWTFWAGDHWRGADAAIVDQDWTINEAGQRYLDLMDEWTTETSGVTNFDGVYEFTGFHGDYEIEVVIPGEDPVEEEIVVSSDTDLDVFEVSVDGVSGGGTEVIPGDVTNSGDVNLWDVEYLIEYYLEIRTIEELPIYEEGLEATNIALDVNQDGTGGTYFDALEAFQKVIDR